MGTKLGSTSSPRDWRIRICAYIQAWEEKRFGTSTSGQDAKATIPMTSTSKSLIQEHAIAKTYITDILQGYIPDPRHMGPEGTDAQSYNKKRGIYIPPRKLRAPIRSDTIPVPDRPCTHAKRKQQRRHAIANPNAMQEVKCPSSYDAVLQKASKGNAIPNDRDLLMS